MARLSVLLSAPAVLLATALLATASAIPATRRAALDVYTPKIYTPTSGANWPSGSVQNVTWDVSAVPPSRANSTGTLFLGYTVDGSDSENLDIEHPLADNFLIRQGWTHITVPKVTPGEKYFVVLIGDSGDKSPYFTIKAPASQNTLLK